MRRLWLGVLLCSTALSVACIGEPDTDLDLTFAWCEPLVLAPEGDVSDDERAAIAEAAALWRAVLPVALTMDPAAGASVLPIVFDAGAVLVHGVYEDEVGRIVVNRALSGAARTITVAHELGHAMGLLHIPTADRASVMNSGNLMLAPTDADALELRAAWPACPPDGP